MKVLIFGIGGIGGLVGGALANHYDDIYFYARGATEQAIAHKGLRLDSAKLGNILVKPKVVSHDPQAIGQIDLVFLCTKGDHLKEVCQDLAPMVGPKTIVIPLLNGVLVSDQLKDHLPPCILADGIIRTFSHVEEPGHIVQDGGPCDIRFGLQGGQNPESFQAIAHMLTEAGLETEVTQDIELASWKKLAITGTMSAILCYYKGNTGYVKSQPNYQAIVDGAYREIHEVAAEAGVIMHQSYIETIKDKFLTSPDDTITSLYRDLASGKKPQDTELDLMVGYVVKKGKELGIPTPIFQKAYENYKNK